MPHFAIITEDGDTLGVVLLERSEWRIGSIIPRDDGDGDLRVLRQLKSRDPKEFAILVVEQV